MHLLMQCNLCRVGKPNHMTNSFSNSTKPYLVILHMCRFDESSAFKKSKKNGNGLCSQYNKFVSLCIKQKLKVPTREVCACYFCNVLLSCSIMHQRMQRSQKPSAVQSPTHVHKYSTLLDLGYTQL